MRSRSKRRRSRDRWASAPDLRPYFWGALLVNLVVAAYYSPLTSLTHVRVVGATAAEQAELKSYFEPLAGVPALQLSSSQIASDLVAKSDVRIADFRVNLFGRGLLKLEHHRPVAQIVDTAGLLLSADGTLFRTENEPENLMLLVLPTDFIRPNVSLFDNWQPGTIAVLCENIEEVFSEISWRIIVHSDRSINLVEPGGAVVRLGSAESLDEKLAVLKEILDNDPEFLESTKQLNLIAPGKPVRTPKQ